jgi:hypothetical protein
MEVMCAFSRFFFGQNENNLFFRGMKTIYCATSSLRLLGSAHLTRAAPRQAGPRLPAQFSSAAAVMLPLSPSCWRPAVQHATFFSLCPAEDRLELDPPRPSGPHLRAHAPIGGAAPCSALTLRIRAAPHALRPSAAPPPSCPPHLRPWWPLLRTG